MIAKNNFSFKNFVIFEMSKNHAGKVELGKRIVSEFGKLAKEENIKAAVKLQFRDLDSYIHPDFRKGGDERMQRYYSSHLSKEDFKKIVDAIHEAGMYSMSTPFDENSVDTINELGVQIIKIASASVRDWPLLEKVSETSKPVVVSTGGLTMDEVDGVVSFLRDRNVNFTILHCVGIYPTPVENAELNRIRLFADKYPDIEVGFSTHEDPDDLSQVQIAYALGARCFEKHVIVLDEKTKDDPSYQKVLKYTATPEQIKRWIHSLKTAVTLLGTEDENSYKPTDTEIKSLASMKRGVYAKKDLLKGDKLNEENVFFAIPLQESQLEVGDWKKDLVAKDSVKAGAQIKL